MTNINDAANLILSKLQSWLESLVVMLPNLVLAVLVVLFFYLLAKLIRNLSEKVLSSISQHVAVNKLITTLIYIGILALGTFVALGVLNLDKTVTSLLAGAGIIGLALSFAFQDTATNLIAGVTLAIQRPLHVGDVVKTNDYFGTIERIHLRSTHLRTPDGQIIIIPNKEVLQKPIENYTLTGERRIDLQVGISYGEDLEHARDVTLAAVNKIDYLLTGKPVEFLYEEFGDSSINFVVRYWIEFHRQVEFKQAVSDGIMLIKKAYNENGITIPFPIRTLDFGIKGGEKLSSMWPEQSNGSGRASSHVKQD